MELNYDWRRFQAVFHPARKPLPEDLDESPIVLVCEEDTVLWAYCEGEDFSEWKGESFKKMAAELAHRKLVSLPQEKIEHWVQEALHKPHFYDQVESIRDSARIEIKSMVQRHFLLDGLVGWWERVLPKTYGIFIRTEGKRTQDFFMLLRKGRVEIFHEPDLSFLDSDRRKNPDDVVKYLSKKNLVKVQGLVVSHEEWVEWAQERNPWKKMASSIGAKRTQLIPHRLSVMILINSRAWIKI